MKYKKFIWIFVAFIGLTSDRVQTDIGLNKAAHTGNIQKVIKLLSSGSNVNGKGWEPRRKFRIWISNDQIIFIPIAISIQGSNGI